jgi:hypothetical protein
MNGLAKVAANNNYNDPNNNNGKGQFYEEEDPTTPLSLEEALEKVSDAEDDVSDSLRQLFASPYNINANNSNNSAAIVSAEEAANSAREAAIAVLKAAINASAEVSNSIKAANKAKAAMNKLRERAARNRDEQEKTRKELEALMAILGAGGELIKIGGKQAGAKLVEAAGGVLTATKKVTVAVAHNALFPTIGAALGGVKAALAMLEGATLAVARGADVVAAKALEATGRVAVAGLGAAGRGAMAGLRAAGRGAMAGLDAAGKGAMAGLDAASHAATARLDAILREPSPPMEAVRQRGRAGSPNRRVAIMLPAEQNNPAAGVAPAEFQPLIPLAPPPNTARTTQPLGMSTTASGAPPPPPPSSSSTSMSFNPRNNRPASSPTPNGATPGARLRKLQGYANINIARQATGAIPPHLRVGTPFIPISESGTRTALPASAATTRATRNRRPTALERSGVVKARLLNMSRVELLNMANAYNLTGYANYNKDKLADAIIQAKIERGEIQRGGTRKISHKKRNNTKRRK